MVRYSEEFKQDAINLVKHYINGLKALGFIKKQPPCTI